MAVNRLIHSELLVSVTGLNKGPYRGQPVILSTLYVMNLCRYSDQKSLPIPLDKGKYYYMETIMKDDHQNDHLEVGMQTPDGKNYTVIPSAFLRTTLPVPPSKSGKLCTV